MHMILIKDNIRKKQEKHWGKTQDDKTGRRNVFNELRWWLTRVTLETNKEANGHKGNRN